MHYRNAIGDPAVLQPLIREAAETVRARDEGALVLDERKGLVGPEYFRRKKR